MQVERMNVVHRVNSCLAPYFLWYARAPPSVPGTRKNLAVAMSRHP